MRRLNTAEFVIIYFDPLDIRSSIVVDIATLTITSLEVNASQLFGHEVTLDALDVATLEGLIATISEFRVDMVYVPLTDIQVLVDCVQSLNLVMHTRTAISIYTQAISSKLAMTGNFLADLLFPIHTNINPKLLMNTNATTRLAVEVLTNLQAISTATAEVTTRDLITIVSEWSQRWDGSMSTILAFFMGVASDLASMFSTTISLTQLELNLLHAIMSSTVQVSATMVLWIPITLAALDPLPLSDLDTSTLGELKGSII